MVSWSAVGEGLKKILLGDSILLILYLLERHLLGLKALSGLAGIFFSGDNSDMSHFSYSDWPQ